MKLHILLLTLSQSIVFSGELLFEDKFERNEPQELKDELGNGWTTNHDKPWSQGAKQTDLRGGVIHVSPAVGDKTNLLVMRDLDFKNGTIALRFKFPTSTGAKGRFGLVFADKGLKNVHAGHVLSARIRDDKILLTDMLTGGFDPEIWKRKKAGQLAKEDKAVIRSKTKRFPYTPKPNEWQELRVTIQGDRLSISIDGKELGFLKSKGIAHPSKTILRLAPITSVSIDDFRIYAGK